MVPREPWCLIYWVPGVRESSILVVVVGGGIHCWLLGVLPNSECLLRYMLVRANALPGNTSALYDAVGGSFRPYVFKLRCHAYCGSLSHFCFITAPFWRCKLVLRFFAFSFVHTPFWCDETLLWLISLFLFSHSFLVMRKVFVASRLVFGLLSLCS